MRGRLRTVPAAAGGEQHQQQRLLAVQPVLGLIEDDRRGRLEDLGGDFLAAVRRQAVHEQRAGLGERHQRRRSPDTARTPAPRSSASRFLAHRRPRVGVDRVGAGDGVGGVGEQPQPRAVPRDAASPAARRRAAAGSRSGLATWTWTPSIAAACASDVATLLPSPTYAIVRPRSVPQRSCSVRKSASAWHGCSSSVSALMTCSRGAAAANSSSTLLRERADDDARRPSARGCARRRRPARGVPSATSGCSATTWPPSSRTAISKVDPRPQRRLLEQQRDVPAVERVGGRRVRARARGRPSPAPRARGSARDRPASKSRTERKSLRRARVGVGHGAVMLMFGSPR